MQLDNHLSDAILSNSLVFDVAFGAFQSCRVAMRWGKKGVWEARLFEAILEQNKTSSMSPFYFGFGSTHAASLCPYIGTITIFCLSKMIIDRFKIDRFRQVFITSMKCVTFGLTYLNQFNLPKKYLYVMKKRINFIQ